MPNSLRPEQLLAAILSTMEDGILSFTLDGTIQTWSRGAERLYGYAEAEMLGQPLAQLLPLYEAPSYERLLHAALKGEFPSCEKTEGLRMDGSIVRVTLNHTPIRNEHGSITAILEIGRALLCEYSEAAEKTQLGVLAEQMPIVLWTTDQNLRIKSHWGGGFRETRIRPGELVGRSVFEYLKCHKILIPLQSRSTMRRCGESPRVSNTNGIIASSRFIWSHYAAPPMKS